MLAHRGDAVSGNARRSSRPGEDLDGAAPVGRAWPGGRRSAGLAAAASSPNRAASASSTAPRVPVDGAGGERLGLGGPHDRRRDRAEGEAHRPGRPVDGEAGAGDGDHHRVAHADLGVALPAVEHGHGDRGDQLARPQGRALDAGHELADRHRARAVGPERARRSASSAASTGQPVAGRRARGEVAADRRRVADLRRADRARRLGERRQQRRPAARSPARRR